jgi:phosphopantothenoylcysteine decarboxylase/phosphopantothenate--cysteine ligase
MTKVVVTAGPTREYIDPVRYLSNESSGKMGFAIAEAAAEAGHDVVLIAGPVQLESPRGVRRRDVVSARDMLDVLQEEFADAGALFMAAAVADYRPAEQLADKWKA